MLAGPVLNGKAKIRGKVGLESENTVDDQRCAIYHNIKMYQFGHLLLTVMILAVHLLMMLHVDNSLR